MISAIQLWEVSALITTSIPQLCCCGLSTFTDHVKLDVGMLEGFRNWVGVSALDPSLPGVILSAVKDPFSVGCSS